MKIALTSVLVDDQEKALRFYTDVLGFAVKNDVPLGEHRWLTVVSPESPDGVELVLEPDEHPAARPFKAALVADGIPFTAFAVDDVHAETARLIAKHEVASSRQAISQHIDVLVEAGLVVTRREGRYRFHHLDPRPLEQIAERWLRRRTLR